MILTNQLQTLHTKDTISFLIGKPNYLNFTEILEQIGYLLIDWNQLTSIIPLIMNISPELAVYSSPYVLDQGTSEE